MTAMLLLFVFMGAFGGYASARLYKAFKGEQWKLTTVRTALTFPGVVSAIFVTLNFLIWGQKSSGAVPFGTLCLLIFLWFGISVPLCFVGSYFGYKKPAPEVRAGRGRGRAKACCSGGAALRPMQHLCTRCWHLCLSPLTPSPFPPLAHRTPCAPTRSRARCRSSRGT